MGSLVNCETGVKKSLLYIGKFKCQHAFLLVTAVISANIWEAKIVHEVLMKYMCCVFILCVCVSEIGCHYIALGWF